MTNNVITDQSGSKSILSVFDFDGTLTYYDSFIPFLYFVFGKNYFVSRMIRMTLSVIYYVCRKLSRDELKETLIKVFLTNVNERWLCRQAEIFCKKNWAKMIRPAAILTVAKEVHCGAEVIICSASPEIVLRPFANKLGIKFIGTQLEVMDGKLTGRIIGRNCRCLQKILMLEQIYGTLGRYYLRAWGDSSGDYELLSVAQEPHWQYFHTSHLATTKPSNKA